VFDEKNLVTYLGCVSVLGHTVQSSSGDVLVRVGGRDGKDQNTAEEISVHQKLISDNDLRVDNGRKNPDTGRLDGNDERRSRSTTGSTPCGSLGEQSRVGVDNHTNDQNTDNVEEQDSVESLSDSGRNGLSGVLGFTDGYSDKLSSHVGKEGENESVDETEEST
jgi:hypothetical protein